MYVFDIHSFRPPLKCGSMPAAPAPYDYAIVHPRESQFGWGVCLGGQTDPQFPPRELCIWRCGSPIRWGRADRRPLLPELWIWWPGGAMTAPRPLANARGNGHRNRPRLLKVFRRREFLRPLLGRAPSPIVGASLLAAVMDDLDLLEASAAAEASASGLLPRQLVPVGFNRVRSEFPRDTAE